MTLVANVQNMCINANKPVALKFIFTTLMQCINAHVLICLSIENIYVNALHTLTKISEHNDCKAESMMVNNIIRVKTRILANHI